MRGKRSLRAFLTLVLSLVLVLTLLSGCGSKSSTEKTEEKETEAVRPEEGERAPGSEKRETEAEVSDTIRWFNASYAILTDLNGWDYNLFGGMEPTPSNEELEKQLLDEWWGVTDRASADETLDWILAEGHRAEFADNMTYLEEDGFGELSEEERVPYLLQYYEMDEDEANFYTNCYTMYEQYGIDAITGWDCCRAMNLLGYYYLAGYYTEEEALDQSLVIAQDIQTIFGSWDELVDSYLRGYEYWAEESSDDRRAVYEDLKTRADNPFAVDYNMTLEKTW